MADTQDQAFIKQFEADAHLAYQQKGSKLRNTVRLRSGVKGSSIRFQKVGKGAASTKTRHGDIALMEAAHTFIDITLADYYAGDYVDALDELKTNIDEKGIIKDTAAYAIGRKMDELIITAAVATTNSLGTGAATNFHASDKALNAFNGLKKALFKLNKAEVPDDGMRIVLVSPEIWELLMDVEKFASADYVGTDLPYLKGTEARKYLNATWMMHTGLTITGANDAQYTTCLVYHKTAIGLGEGAFLKMDADWEGRKAAHFLSTCMSGNAGLIDVEGCVKVLLNNGLPAA